MDNSRPNRFVKFGFCFALLLLLALAQDEGSGAGPSEGDPAPNMTLLVPGASALPGEAEANTVGPVSGDGVDYASIQEAIDASEPGDVIYVLSGNYSETVDVNKSGIVLKGVDTGEGKPIVSGDGVGSTVTLSADGCTLEGFVVMNSGNPHAGIDVRSNGNALIGNTVRGNRGYGIFVSNSTNNSVERNSISDNGFDGIFLDNSRANGISGSTINGNGMNGVRLLDSSENIISGSLIVHNGFYGTLVERSNYNRITDNTILHNIKGGIRLVDSTGNFIARNNYDDISAVNSEGNTFADNNEVVKYGDKDTDPPDEPDGPKPDSRTIRVRPGESIQNAINQYGSKYIIEVESGTYNENVNVNVPGTTLQGINTGGGAPVINGGGSGDPLTISGGGSTVDGFKVENSGNPHAGIRVTSNGNVISDMVVTGNKGYGIHVTARGNTIRNCVVKDNGNGSGFDAVLLDGGSSRNTISGCEIVGGAGTGDNNGGHGINLSASGSNIISDCSINGGNSSCCGEGEGGGHGIFFESGSNNNEIVENSQISGGGVGGCGGDGISISSSSGNKIRRNSQIGSEEGGGISLDSSDGNEISGNTEVTEVSLYYSSKNEISGNSEITGGINLYDSSENEVSGNSEITGYYGIYLDHSSKNEISGNSEITGIGGVGIGLYGSSNNSIVENKGITGASGIYLFSNFWGETSNNNVIKGNAIVGSSCGMKIEEGCDGNKIYLNEFDNSINAESYSEDNLWSSPEKITYQYNDIEYKNYLGNYWHDYNGSDRGDGIGDTPYVINDTSNETDHYPLMDPGIIDTVGLIDPLFVEKTASVSEVERGETVTYTIRLYNNGDLPATDIVVEDVFNRLVEFTSVSPAPDPDGLWRFDEIGPNESETITLEVRVPKQDLEYRHESRVRGMGFVNVDDAYSTAFDSYTLRNEVFVTYFNQTLGGNDSASDVEDVSVLGGRGTELRTREHGSGVYESDEAALVLTSNRSIKLDKEVSASYEPTTLGLYRNRTVSFSSRWTEESLAKNWATGTSMSESYRYATFIDRESRVELDKNESTMEVESEFEGSGHIGVYSASGPDSSGRRSPDLEMLEDYTGSFRVYEKVDEYGSAVTSERSASGEGLVSADRRLGESQRSSESGSGSYQAEEMIATSTSYIAKDLSLVSAPTSLRLTDNFSVNSSSRWSEGIWSRAKGRSLIAESYSGLDRLDKETVSMGLNAMETEANFSGTASYKTILVGNVDGKVDIDDRYEGDYTLERRVHIRGAPKYDRPHLTIIKEGRLASDPKSCNVFANYNISIENDGNEDLSPVYAKDLFPPGAEFINSTLRPTLGSGSASWTLTHLAVGERLDIGIVLNVTDCSGELLVNRVEATGLYDDQSVTAGNSSSFEVGWLSCDRPESTVTVTKTAYVSSTKPNEIWYLLEVKNNGAGTKVAKVVDTLPTGLVLKESEPEFSSYEDDQVVWNLIDLGPKETRVIVYEVEALWSGMFVNSVSVSVQSVAGEIEASTGTSSSITVDEFEGELSEPGWTAPEWDFDYLAAPDVSI